MRNQLLLVLVTCASITGCSASPNTTSTSDGGVLGDSAVPADGAQADAATNPPPDGAPIVFYTDVVSGPTTGGENDAGTYLSIFGKNFGSVGLGTSVKVRIGTAEVASYRSLGASLGRPDIEQITVQVGALGGQTPGVALPIVVTVDNVESAATGPTFTINPGRMLFVDSAKGNDSTAVPGDISHPYQHVQLSSSSTTALGVAKAGDTLVLRGSGVFTDLGYKNNFVKMINVGGTPPTGASGTGYIAFIPYPGETVKIVNGTGGVSDAAAFSSVAHPDYSGGNYVVVAGLHVEGDGTAGVIALQIGSDHWRVVNNELTSPNTGGVDVLAAGVNGNGPNTVVYGNSIHDITGQGGQSHGLYVDGDGSYDLAYNLIYNVSSGYGIQAYNDGSNGSDTTHAFHVHHNVIHDVTGKGCLNVADGSTTDFVLWENVCYNIKLSCLRFNSDQLVGARIYNNTFYNCSTGSSYDGAIDNDWVALDTSAVVVVNNIVWPGSGIPYLGGSGNGFGVGVFSNNLWYGATQPPSDSHGVTANPEFVSSGSDFHLGLGSPAINVGSAAVLPIVTTNFEGNPVQAGTVDIGAY